MRLNAAHVLEAMEHIAYIVDRNLHIVAYSESNWNRFAKAAGAESLTERSGLLGRSLMDFVLGNEVREFYRHRFQEILAGRTDQITFAYTCNSPDMRRDMRMSLRPIAGHRGVRGILLHSQILSEREQPPVDLYDFAALSEFHSENSQLPLVVMCSFCQDLKADDAGWVKPIDYYRRGGTNKVRISHGICDSCPSWTDD